jgi:hypothetical protein
VSQYEVPFCSSLLKCFILTLQFLNSCHSRCKFRVLVSSKFTSIIHKALLRQLPQVSAEQYPEQQ